MNEEGLNFSSIISEISSRKKFIFLFTFSFLLIGVIYSFSIPNTYQSTALLSVNSDSAGGSSMSSLAKQYGGVASMAGISLPGGEEEDRGVIAMETIKSRNFLRNLILDNDILPQLYAAKSYDFSHKKINYDKKLYDSKNKKWVRKPSLFNRSLKPAPSNEEAYRKYIKETISVYQDKKTNLIYVSVKHFSPHFAKEFLELIIKEMNDSIRDKDLKESEKAINYLNEYLATSQVTEIRKSINDLIETHLEKVMMCYISEDYVLEIIDPPFVPERKHSPSRAVNLFLSFILGLTISIILVVSKSIIFNRK